MSFITCMIATRKKHWKPRSWKRARRKSEGEWKKYLILWLFFFYLSHLFSSVFIAHCSFMFLSLFLTLCLSFSSSSFFCAIRQSWLWQGTSMSDTMHLLLNLFLCENYFTHIFLVLGLLGQHNVWCNTYLVWLTESFWGVLSMPCECEKIICVMKISDKFAQKKTWHIWRLLCQCVCFLCTKVMKCLRFDFCKLQKKKKSSPFQL